MSETPTSSEPVNSNVEPSGTPVEAVRAAPEPVVAPRQQTRVSWIWLVPLLAAAIGLSLVVKDWLHTGPTVTVSFESADGLEVGQTKVRYKDVTIGTVTDIRVSEDRHKVLVHIKLNREGSGYITQEGTRFWVVRPRLAISGVSGLGTLLSGAYIAVDTAKESDSAKGASRTAKYDFVGLEKPPEITSDRPGRRFTLISPDLGSLEVGSPVYYRRIQVGRVIGYDLGPKGQNVHIQVFIDAPNDKFVTSATRFWYVSGVNVSLSAEGFVVQTGSLASVLAGGIAFASAEDYPDAKPSAADSVFPISATQGEAMAEPDGTPFRLDMVFEQSVRGLKIGAPVDFHGMDLGKVYDIDLEYNAKIKRFVVLVKTRLYPSRFGHAYQDLFTASEKEGYEGQALLGPLVKHGLRAQIRSANLLTGQQYIALDFFPKAPPVDFDSAAVPVVLPTIAGSFDRLQQQLSSIVTKLDAVPFDGISQDLRASLKSLTKLIKRLQTEVAPQATATLKAAQQSLGRVNSMLADDSPMNDNLAQTLRELGDAAKSLRALADYLQTHPSALLRGRSVDVLPSNNH
ncbi:MAG: MCE family protein [Candidimonas sp.]|nr:MAG: MCE family protein [Candidimonas sp.]TAM20306.1 MAG: MCE family protein [Candidimonas sp.]TAM79909.1 MAG: MCE family protein [Candidimonas sp.]